LITEKLLLFTDGSVNTKLNFGFGAYLAVNDTEIPASNWGDSVNVKRFENTSSTKLEIQALIWALSEVKEFQGKIVLYTDSQNIIGLPGRRERLEKNNYHSKAGKQITNFELYKQFFQLLDELDFEMKKIEGHKRTQQKDNIDRLFTLVDRASRNALRGEKGA
jgi:ribonuclease HI